MAVSYPITGLVTDYAPGSTPFELRFRHEIARQQSGTIRVKQLGPPLWACHVELPPLAHAAALQKQAALNAMAEGIETFYLVPPVGRYPQSDPTGSTLGASTVQINSVGSSPSRLTLKGLPGLYAITIGDLLSFTMTDGRRAFHQCLESRTANSGGVTSTIEVRPALDSAAAVDDVVTLAQPSAEMIVVPGSVSLRPAGLLHLVVAFDALQVP